MIKLSKLPNIIDPPGTTIKIETRVWCADFSRNPTITVQTSRSKSQINILQQVLYKLRVFR